MNAHTTTAEERIARTEARNATTAEVCFGALMAIGVLGGMWGAVSYLINQFVG